MAAIIPFIARLAEHAPDIVLSPHVGSSAALELFRSCSRRHALTGMRLLKRHREELEDVAGTPVEEALWEEIQRDCRALFLAEMLGRLWAGIIDARSRMECAETSGRNVARYVLLQHLELRREILNLMNRWCSEAYPQVAALDFQCRRMERWTDVLLGPLVKDYKLQDYVFDADRAMEYSFGNDDRSRSERGIVGKLPRKLAIDGFLQSYGGTLYLHPLLREHQTGMIRSILGMLPDDALFSEQRYLLGRIWADHELNRPHTSRRINIAGA